MSERVNLAAWTPADQGYPPPYVSINHQDGVVEITVRESGGGPCVAVSLPVREFERLAFAAAVQASYQRPERRCALGGVTRPMPGYPNLYQICDGCRCQR